MWFCAFLEGQSKEQLHGAGTRQPRRSGNPFLDDSDDDDQRHSSSATTVPGLASTVPPPETPSPPTPGLRSSQAEPTPVGMSGKEAIDSQPPAQQPPGAAPATTPGTPVTTSDPPASAISTERQSIRHLHPGEERNTLQQTSSNPTPGVAHPSGLPPVEPPASSDPEELSPLPVAAAVLANNNEAADPGQTVPRQQGSMGRGSRQADVPSAARAVPTAQPGERLPPNASSDQPAAAGATTAGQPHQAQAVSSPQEAQLLQPSHQGSLTGPQVQQGLDLRHQGGSPRLGPHPEAPAAAPALGGRGVLPPPPQAADRMAQTSKLSSGEGVLDRGRAGPAPPPQQQQGSTPGASPVTASMPASGSEPMGPPLPRQGGQQAQAQGEVQASGLEGMLGRSAPDSDAQEEESAASAQDRQRFMQSLQSPDQGSSRSRNLAKGFGRMRAKAKDMLQPKNAGSPNANRSGQPASSQGLPGEASHAPTGAEPASGRRGRLARDVNMLFAGLKNPTSQQ